MALTAGCQVECPAGLCGKAAGFLATQPFATGFSLWRTELIECERV